MAANGEAAAVQHSTSQRAIHPFCHPCTDYAVHTLAVNARKVDPRAAARVVRATRPRATPMTMMPRSRLSCIRR